MLRGIKKEEENFLPLKILFLYYTAEQSSEAVFPQGYACFTGFSMRPCGTTPVVNASFGRIDKTIRKFICFLKLFVSFYGILLSKEGRFFPPFPALLILACARYLARCLDGFLCRLCRLRLDFLRLDFFLLALRLRRAFRRVLVTAVALIRFDILPSHLHTLEEARCPEKFVKAFGEWQIIRRAVTADNG